MKIFIATLITLTMSFAFSAFAERSEEDRARDAARKPAEVLAFLGIGEGATVVDIWASGGWYTEVLSEAVGPEGRVYAQNSQGVLSFQDGFYDKRLTKRLEGGRLANVIRIDQALSQNPIEAGSADFAMTALNLHDVYNMQGHDATVSFLKGAYNVLKPGGVMGIIDHVGVAGADNNTLHRMQVSQAVEAAEAAGFVVEAQGDVLHHGDDDHTKMVFNPEIRGKTDRFVLKLRKPG